MKRVIVICKSCGKQERIEILTREDLERRPQPTRRPTCTRCGSANVDIRE